MEDLLQMVYVEGDIIQTACKILIFGLSMEFVLGICNLIKTGYSTIRR